MTAFRRARSAGLAAGRAAEHLRPTASPARLPAPPPLCELRQVAVAYGPRLAISEVSLAIRPGEVVALLGENGAGKSTLIHALYGLVPIAAGAVVYRGQPTVASPELAISAGIGLVSQHFLLIPRLTVAENIILGREPRRAGTLPMLYDLRRAEAEIADLGQRYGLAVDPRRRVSELSVGEAQRVEILKTLYRGASCLLLDEPTAVLTPHETRHMLDVLRSMVGAPAGPSSPLAAADSRKGLLIVTHKLDEVMAVADRAVILRAGRVVAEVPRAAFSPREMAHALVGRELVAVSRAPSALPLQSLAPVLAVRELSLDQGGVARLCGVNLALRPGEILGIAGVEGNGQSELCAALVGLLRPTAGQVCIGGCDLTTASVRARRAAGLSFVLEDRQRHGLVLDFSLAENLLLGEQDRYLRGRRWPWRWLIADRRLHAEAERLLAAHDVRPPEPTLAVRALSGGNQQKLLLARALGPPDQPPRVLIVAQPTRGVDIGAVAAIHRVLLAARDRGCAILLVSTELDELRGLCDRIAVLFRGRVVAQLENPVSAPVSRERLGELLAGLDGSGAPVASGRPAVG